jgi:hypothetical protein
VAGAGPNRIAIASTRVSKAEIVARADLTRMENGPAKSVRIASPIHYGAPTATIAHT